MVFSSCRDWVVGLSSKKGQKKKKKIGKHRACDAKKGNMKVAIIRSTSWTAKVFKLRLFFFKSQKVLGGNMETNGNWSDSLGPEKAKSFVPEVPSVMFLS